MKLFLLNLKRFFVPLVLMTAIASTACTPSPTSVVVAGTLHARNGYFIIGGESKRQLLLLRQSGKSRRWIRL